MCIFKNREEIRDKFLYQLREFQNISSKKLLNSEALLCYSSGLKLAANDLLKKIYPCNMKWLAELFGDLFLQIGLISMEETDKEVLSHVADVDRLQVRGFQPLVTKCYNFFFTIVWK